MDNSALAEQAARIIPAAARPWATDEERAVLLAVVEAERDIAWGSMLMTAERLRVAPTIWWQIQHLPRRLVPGTVRRYLQSLFLFYRERNSLMLTEAAVVLRALADKGIHAVVRKGAYLAHHIYPTPATRQFNDIDLLITPDAAREAVATLEQLGYTQGTLSDGVVQALRRDQALFYRLYTNNVPPMQRVIDNPYVHAFTVDLTTEASLPIMPHRLSAIECIEAATAVSIGGAEGLVHAPEYLLVDLCLHNFKESTTLRYISRGGHLRMNQYVDLLVYLTGPSAPQVNWGRFMDLVARSGSEQPCFFALTNTERLFPGTVPQQVLGALGANAGVTEAIVDEYGAIDLDEPLRWRVPFPLRVFAELSPPRLPQSRSLV